jgi:ABC-type uncharacterized transport system auxiliary subunit
MNTLFSCLCLTATLVMNCGCGPRPYNKRYYILDVERETEALRPNRELILEVRRFTIDAAFESKGLVYRKGEFEYESDFYNEFLTLEGNITALYGDFQDKSSPQAVMEIRVFLIAAKAPGESITLGKTYRASLDLKSERTEGLVEAFGRCLEKILSDLEEDLNEKLRA